MIKEWLAEYEPQNEIEAFDALREIMQEIVLAALSRTNFFEKAAFYGGTALRIFYGLERYSEDLDFSLLEVDPAFALEPYFLPIIAEFEALGMRVSMREKDKKEKNNIESAFLKSETEWKELVLEDVVKQTGISVKRQIRIKIEVDREPPLGFGTEEKLLVKPFSFYVKCFTPKSLFAGKLHALLFRKWQNRVKGRDWYDLEWYIKKGIPLDLNHFRLRASDTGHWHKEDISPEEVLDLVQKKMAMVSFDSIKQDVSRFIKDDAHLAVWNAAYFGHLIEKMKFV